MIADSSTEAMPSITVPSPGITSPASTTTTSPRAQLGGGTLAAVAQAGDGVGAHRAQRVGLRLAAALGERLGEVREDDGQPQPERDREGEPGGLVAAAERARRRRPGSSQPTVVITAPTSTTNITGLRTAAAGRACAGSSSAGAGSPRQERAGSVLIGAAASSSRARLSSSTFTPGSPRKPRRGRRCARRSALEHAVERQPADRGDPVRLDPGVGLRDVRVDAGRRVGDRVDRDVGDGQPGS